jgi:hypothetical protein
VNDNAVEAVVDKRQQVAEQPGEHVHGSHHEIRYGPNNHQTWSRQAQGRWQGPPSSGGPGRVTAEPSRRHQPRSSQVRPRKRDEARELLAPVYGWFTEGFETARSERGSEPT